MRLRVYLDTSVLSALMDDRTPERQRQTRDFRDRREEYDLGACDLARRELEQVPDAALRRSLLGLLDLLSVQPVTDDMKEVASKYVEMGLFTPSTANDALHVAAATIMRQDVLLSWNFRHMVNRRRRALISQANMSLGLPVLEILAPPEL